MKSVFPLLLCLIGVCGSTKIAIFMLDVSNSQVIWNKRVAESLLTGGHDVTMVMIRPFNKQKVKIDIDPRVEVHIVEAAMDMDAEALEKEQAALIFQDLPMWDSRQRALMGKMSTAMTGACEKLLQNKEFLKWLPEQKFDLAFSHMYDSCPIGLIHYAQIPTWIWLNSGALMDHVADAVGVPLIPSYVPPMMMEAGSRMSFYERIKSFIGHGLMKVLYPRFIPNKQTALFRQYISHDFPDLIDLARTCPLVLVNSNELYELARPTLHKVVYIGGLGMQFKDAKPLSSEFQAIVDKARKGVILMSFGSVTKIDLMPEPWKNAFLTAFARLPQYEFVLRYDGNDLDGRKPDNVHLHKWLPQNDLLKHPKVAGFISHGGYNSLQETLAGGKPIMTIPLFGDQPKNAKLAEQSGFGVNVRKSTLDADAVEEAVRKMVDDHRYAKVSRRISEMVKRKPIKADELLLKWTDFLAEFKSLETLVPYGVELSFVQYHSLDVIAFLALSVFLIVYVVVKMAKFIIRKCLSVVRTDDKKKKKSD